MNWLESIENFENTLQEARRLALHLQSRKGSLLAGGLAMREGAKRFKEFEKSEQFLFNLEELKSFCPRIHEKYFIRLLDKASLAIKHPQSTKYCNDLLTACEELHPMLSKAGLDSKKEASRKVDAYAFNATVGILMAGCLATAVGIAILAGGPLGLLAFAAAGAVAALIVGAISAYNININAEFLEDKQYNVIAGFAQQLVDAADDGQNPERRFALSAA